MNLIEISQQVRAQRKAMGLTQTSLAQRTGISRATINALENGSLSDLGTSRLTIILQALGLALDVVAIPSRRPTLEDRYREQAATAQAHAGAPPYRG